MWDDFDVCDFIDDLYEIDYEPESVYGNEFDDEPDFTSWHRDEFEDEPDDTSWHRDEFEDEPDDTSWHRDEFDDELDFTSWHRNEFDNKPETFHRNELERNNQSNFALLGRGKGTPKEVKKKAKRKELISPINHDKRGNSVQNTSKQLPIRSILKTSTKKSSSEQLEKTDKPKKVRFSIEEHQKEKQGNSVQNLSKKLPIRSILKTSTKKSSSGQFKKTDKPKKVQFLIKEYQKKRPFLKYPKPSKTDLTAAIRKFSASKVKIPKRNTRWARKMADTHIEFIRKYCQEKSKGIFNHFEFTGSFYEHLKAEDANELDILVALDTKDNAHLIVEEVVPGYARIKVTKKSSKYWRFVKDNDGYVRPAKVRSWFFGLVQQAVNQYKSNKKEKDPLLKPSDNGPAAKLLIDDKEEKKKLEVDLVPAFLFKPKKDRSLAVPAEGRHYVAKQLPQRMITKDLQCPREMLWRQSFSLQEKKKMENVDKKDSGCRREVVKVLKTIVKNDSTLAKLSSYHIKTAFLHYNFDEGQEDLEWSAQHLAERLKGLMEYLRHNISERSLSHFFINELDLLMELSGDTLANIEGRLNKLINDESELRRALTVQPENLNNEAKTKKKSKKKTKKSNNKSVQK